MSDLLTYMYLSFTIPLVECFLFFQAFLVHVCRVLVSFQNEIITS